MWKCHCRAPAVTCHCATIDVLHSPALSPVLMQNWVLQSRWHHWMLRSCVFTTKLYILHSILTQSCQLPKNPTSCCFLFKSHHVSQLALFFNPLNAELNPICCLLALLGAHHFLHISRIRVKSLALRLLMSYIYGAPILDVSRSHTTTHHSR